MIEFPAYKDSAAASKIRDLERLLDRTLTNTQYTDGLSAAKLLGTLLASYRSIVVLGNSGPLGSDDRLRAAHEKGTLFGLVLAAGFDIMCNAEYLHGRLTDNRWIYCHRDGEEPKVYYSFLKQCPTCCLDKGLGNRLSGAQHKPTSHHIGEITTTAICLILQLIAAASKRPFEIATITKQSHDVDAVGFSEDFLILFEIKASPMVSYPIVAKLPRPLFRDSQSGMEEYPQHALVDFVSHNGKLALSIPQGNWNIPLPNIDEPSWPYKPITDFLKDPESAAKFISSWIELFDAYSIPKKKRADRNINLAYLVNGWGDEIDSNKTKPGLGRTDDIKKGTYQLLKFGGYYRDDKAKTKIRGALVANLDPMFLRADYIDGLVDARWGHNRDFSLKDGEYRIAEESLRHVYDGIVAFNNPTLNDPTLHDLFDLSNVKDSLIHGKLDSLLETWCSDGPDEAIAEITE